MGILWEGGMGDGRDGRGWMGREEGRERRREREDSTLEYLERI